MPEISGFNILPWFILLNLQQLILACLIATTTFGPSYLVLLTVILPAIDPLNLFLQCNDDRRTNRIGPLPRSATAPPS